MSRRAPWPTLLPPVARQSAARLASGPTAYNYRGADGSPFGNFWYGTTTQGTLEFSLTGTFTATSWNINGGTVRYNDPGFLCQHGGSGSLPADPSAGVFCASLPYSGVKQHNGAHLSWGWDLDGNGPITAISQIEVRDASGQNLVTSLAGVLASLSVDGAGNITTNDGEFRRATDSQGACAGSIRWDGTRMTCGAFTVGKVNITGSVVPVPGAVWLFGSALGATALLRRKARQSDVQSSPLSGAVLPQLVNAG